MESSLVTLQKTERLSGRGGEKSTERVIVSPTMTTELSFWQIILPSHVARSSPNSKKSAAGSERKDGEGTEPRRGAVPQ